MKYLVAFSLAGAVLARTFIAGGYFGATRFFQTLNLEFENSVRGANLTFSEWEKGRVKR